MSVFWFELRKIWSIRIVLAIAALGAMYFYLFPYFYIEHFENGPGAEAQMSFAREWLGKYGTTLDDAEMREIREDLSNEVAAFARTAQSVPGAAEAGIQTLEDFRLYHAQEESDMDLISRILGTSNLYRLEALEGAIRMYDQRMTADQVPPVYTPVQAERILSEQNEPASVLPASVLVNDVREYCADLSSWCVISVILLLAPTFVRDRIRATRPLQWASRTGRGVFPVQLRAGLLSALVLTAINTAIYAVPFLMHDPLRFVDCSLSNTVFPAGNPWVDWTYGEFLLAEIALVFLCGIGAGAGALLVSRFSTNYVSMAFMELPLLVFAGLLFAPWAADAALYIHEPWINAGFFMPEGTEFLCTAVFVVAAFLLVVWCMRRQKFAEC